MIQTYKFHFVNSQMKKFSLNQVLKKMYINDEWTFMLIGNTKNKNAVNGVIRTRINL